MWWVFLFIMNPTDLRLVYNQNENSHYDHIFLSIWRESKIDLSSESYLHLIYPIKYSNSIFVLNPNWKKTHICCPRASLGIMGTKLWVHPWIPQYDSDVMYGEFQGALNYAERRYSLGELYVWLILFFSDRNAISDNDIIIRNVIVQL